jgi:hypothetical protein
MPAPLSNTGASVLAVRGACGAAFKELQANKIVTMMRLFILNPQWYKMGNYILTFCFKDRPVKIKGRANAPSIL